MSRDQKKVKLSTSQEDLSNWLARVSTRGIAAVLVRRNIRDDTEPLTTIEVKTETFSADRVAQEIISTCQIDAQVVGGSVTYSVTVCDEKGMVLANIPVGIETGLPSADARRGMSAENEHISRQYDALLSQTFKFAQTVQGAYEKLADHNSKLIDQVHEGHTVVQKALDMSNERDIRKEQAASEIRMKEQGFSGLTKLAAVSLPQWLKQKGMSAETADALSKMMMAQAAQAEPQASAQPSKPGDPSPIVSVVSSIPEEKIVAWLDTLTDDKKASFVAMLPPEKLQEMIGLFQKYEAKKAN